MQARWLALLLMAVGSAILHPSQLRARAAEDERDAVIDVMASPLRTALLQGVMLLAIVQLVWWLGRPARWQRAAFPMRCS